MISSIELRWRDVVAHVPALLTNELPPVSWSYISHTSSWLHCVHLGMDIGADLVREFFAKLLTLSWTFLGGATTVGDDWGSFGFVNNHKGVLL